MQAPYRLKYGPSGIPGNPATKFSGNYIPYVCACVLCKQSTHNRAVKKIRACVCLYLFVGATIQVRMVRFLLCSHGETVCDCVRACVRVCKMIESLKALGGVVATRAPPPVRLVGSGIYRRRNDRVRTIYTHIHTRARAST